MLDECPFAQFALGEGELLTGVHDNRACPCDRLSKWFGTVEEDARPLRSRLHREGVPFSKKYRPMVRNLLVAGMYRTTNDVDEKGVLRIERKIPCRIRFELDIQIEGLYIVTLQWS